MSSILLRASLAAAIAGACGLAAQSAQAGACGDPWVTQAVTSALGRAPSGPGAPECNIYLYNGGHWSSYPQLRLAVGTYWGTHSYPQAPPAYGRQTTPGYGNLQLAPSRADITVNASQLGYGRGAAPVRGQTVRFNGRTYQVANTIAQGGGNFAVVLHLINMDGAGIVINQGSN